MLIVSYSVSKRGNARLIRNIIGVSHVQKLVHVAESSTALTLGEPGVECVLKYPR